MKAQFFSGVVSGREDGAVLVFVALAISLMVVGVTSLAVDSSHMVMVRNQLQKSADAAALAGAAVLFNPSDGSINPGASTEAEELARENPAAGADRASGSTAHDKLDVDVRRGHWSFATETFTQNETTTQLAGWQGMTYAQLDVNTNFINAVQVKTARENTRGIFTNIFGWKDTDIATDAVAYLGFVAEVPEDTVDIPYAICLSALTIDENLACGIARSQSEGIETGGWTNFSQDRLDPPEECTSSNAATVNNEILMNIPPGDCEDLNTSPLTQGGIGTINGNVASTYKIILEHCFVDVPDLDTDHTYVDHGGEEVVPVPEIEYTVTQPWLEVTVPVVNCNHDEDFDFAGGNCDAAEIEYVTVVTVDIVWMSFDKQNVPVEYHYNDIDWACIDPSNPELCWQDFQDTYSWDFVDPDGDGLPENKAMYFAPGCEYTESVGSTGSFNSGIMAKIPVLVE